MIESILYTYFIFPGTQFKEFSLRNNNLFIMEGVPVDFYFVIMVFQKYCFCCVFFSCASITQYLYGSINVYLSALMYCTFYCPVCFQVHLDC
jgi:hypothetical protein